MKKFFPLVLVFVVGAFFADTVFAGFGITPPYVRNTSLTRNSIYEQTILLVRSDPAGALKADITTDVPGANEWFEVLEGDGFTLPAGEQKVPMTVRVTVPDDAEFKTYRGNIRVRTSASDEDLSAGSVNIALGAQIDVDLNIIDKVIKDFRVRKVTISDLNEGHKVGWLYFPGKIRFNMLIENTGNTPVSPDKVVFRLYDPTGQVLLEETEHTNKITKVDPFQTEEVTAELPTRLPTGSYVGRYEIHNEDEIKQEGELTISIVPYGTLQTAGYGFAGLSIAHKISIVLPILVFLSFTFLIMYQMRGKKKVRRRMVSKK